MKAKQLFIAILIISNYLSAQLNFDHRGIGGGGAFYRPSINPANPDEFYIQTDMGEVYHSTNYGKSYDQIPYTTFLGALTRSGVVYTNDNNIRYKIAEGNSLYGSAFGIYKTINAGASWILLPLPTGCCHVNFGYINADYYNPNRIIAGTYDKVWYSNDGGYNYSEVLSLSNFGGAYNECFVAGSFFDGNDIYVAGRFGMKVSHDAGTSWSTMALPGIDPKKLPLLFVGAKQNGAVRFYTIAVDTVATGCFANAFECYTNYGYGSNERISVFGTVYRMDVANGNWLQIMNGINQPPTFNIGTNRADCMSGNCDDFIGIGMAENDTSTVYLSAYDHVTFKFSIMKTVNGGSSWNKITFPDNNQNMTSGWLGGDFPWGYSGLTDMGVCRMNSNRVIITDLYAVHGTSDGGNTWHEQYTSNEFPMNSVTPPNQYYASIGLENTGAWCMQWSSPTDLFAGFTDIRGMRSKDGGLTWSFDYTGHNLNTMYCIAKHNTQNVLFATTSELHDMYKGHMLKNIDIERSAVNRGAIMYSLNNGAAWNMMYQTLNAAPFWITTDPNNDNKLYASFCDADDGEGGIYVCSDAQNLASATWTKLPNPPRTQGHAAYIRVLNDGKVVCTYSGHQSNYPANYDIFKKTSGVFLYDPSNGTWQDLSIPEMLWTKDIIIDPTDVSQNTWYVGVNGYPFWTYTTTNDSSSWDKAGLYKTTDRGLNWTKLIGVDSLKGVNSLFFNPNNLDQVFMTTDRNGLWMCNNIHTANPSFQQVSSYPYIQSERVFFNPYKQSEMWVCAWGNAMMVTDLTTLGIKKEIDLSKIVFEIYPVPAHDNIAVVGSNDLGVISVYNSLGKLIDKIATRSSIVEINVNDYSNGVYFIRSGNVYEKFIVSH